MVSGLPILGSGMVVAQLLIALLSAPPPPPAGEPSTLEVATHPTIWADAGTRLWSRPEAGADLVARLDAPVELTILDRRPGWLRVRWGAYIGWVPWDDNAKRIGSHRAATAADGRAADRESLAFARSLLGPDERQLAVGEWRLYTDVRDPELLQRLDRVARRLPRHYHRRFDVDPAAEPLEAVVLFASTDSLRRFASAGGARRSTRAFARDGIAALAMADRPADLVVQDLVHELTHLLNRRVFASLPPAWLEEGLAGDLAFCRVEENGGLALGSLSGEQTVREEPRYREGGWFSVDMRVEETGPLAALRFLQRDLDSGRAPLPTTWIALDRDRFLASDGRRSRYDAATFFVRYLLDGGNRTLRRRFLGYLRRLATEAEPPSFETVLDQDPSGLDAAFAEWLAGLSPADRSAAGLPRSPRDAMERFRSRTNRSGGSTPSSTATSRCCRDSSSSPRVNRATARL